MIKPPERRGKFRNQTFQKIEKFAEKVDVNFPKTLIGIGIIGAGIGCNYIGLVIASNWLINIGIGLAVAGIGLKLNRKANGGKIFQNEINLLKSLIKRR